MRAQVISYLGLLVQFSPATGRTGRCGQISLCVGSTPRVPATLGLPRTGVSVLSPSTLLRLLAALYGAGPVLSAVPVFGYSTKARIRLCLRFVSSPAWAVQAARGLGALSPGVARLFSPRRAARAAQRLGPIEYFIKVTSIPAYAHLSTLRYYFKYQYNTELSACILLISEKNVSSDTRQSCFQSLLVITTSYIQYKY